MRKNSDPYKLIKAGATLSTTSVPIKIKNIVWKMPHVNVDNKERLNLIKNIEKEQSLFVLFISLGTYE